MSTSPIQPPPGTVERTANRPSLDTVLSDTFAEVSAKPQMSEAVDAPQPQIQASQSSAPESRRGRPWNRAVSGQRNTAERLAAFRKATAARALIKEDGSVVSADEPSFVVQNKKNPVAQAARKDLSRPRQDWKPGLASRVGGWMSSHRGLTFAMVAGTLALGPAGLAIVLALANRRKIGKAVAATPAAIARGAVEGADKVRVLAADFMVKHGNPAIAAVSAQLVNAMDVGRRSLKDLLAKRNPQPAPAVQASGRKPGHG